MINSKFTKPEASDEQELSNGIVTPSSVAGMHGGSRANLLRPSKTRTDSIREENESESVSEQTARSSRDNGYKTDRVRLPAELADAHRLHISNAGKVSPQAHISTEESSVEESSDDEGEREGRRGSVMGKVAHKAKLALPLRRAKEATMTESPHSPVGMSLGALSTPNSSRKEAGAQGRRPSADQGHASKIRTDGPSAPSSAVNRQKKLPTPLMTKASGGSSFSGNDGLSENLSAHTNKLSPTGIIRPNTVSSGSTSNDALDSSHDTPAVASSTVKRSNKIIEFSTADSNLTETGKDLNAKSLSLKSPSMLTSPAIETKRKPSMNSIKEGVEITATPPEPQVAAGDGSSQGGNSDPRGSSRQFAQRSTSALKINSMSNTTPSNLITIKSSPKPDLKREKRPPTFEPPLPEQQGESEVQPAPPSGMYWSKAPCFGYDHNALRAHTATLVGSNIYVFGGCDSHACFNDLYVFDADCMYWTAPECTGEVPPVLRAMTATAVGKKVIIFGGGDGPAYYNDVYVLDTLNLRYSKPKISGTHPSKRRAHTACLYKHGIYIFGGGDGVKALNDIWRLEVSDSKKMSWKLISPPSKSGGRPTARGYHTSNMVGSKLIIFGGSDGLECFRDVWVFDVDTQVWRAVEIKVSFPRLSHTATIIGSYLFVIGGHDGVEYSSDVLLLNLVTMQWDKRKIYGTPPSGRGYHGTVLHDSRLFVIGGFDG